MKGCIIIVVVVVVIVIIIIITMLIVFMSSCIAGVPWQQKVVPAEQQKGINALVQKAVQLTQFEA